MKTSNGGLFSLFWCIREGRKDTNCNHFELCRPQVLEVYDDIVWENADDKHKPDKALEAFQNYCNPRGNEVLESHRFWNTPYQEPFYKFLTELKTRPGEQDDER